MNVMFGCLILGKLYYDSKDVAMAWTFMALAIASVAVEFLKWWLA